MEAPPPENHGARFTTRSGPPAAVVAVDGDIDAANAGRFADHVQRCAAGCGCLIVDLRGVEFFGTEGFSVLHGINVRCAEAGVRWAVVPSAAVRRLLSICDPDEMLPTAPTVTAALTDDRRPQRLSELVPQVG
ncbi:STAS domain-containing protein [Mycobacterium sp.]|uniref:STAS domain-containing protein n=1 Tax=Mycobacterium sp. TaxID=1785 RepID=UPI0031D7441A